jgi:hypothetical protein
MEITYRNETTANIKAIFALDSDEFRDAYIEGSYIYDDEALDFVFDYSEHAVRTWTNSENENHYIAVLPVTIDGRNGFLQFEYCESDGFGSFRPFFPR